MIEKIKVSERELKCLKVLAEEYDADANCFYTRYIAKKSGLTFPQAKRSVRALARKGLAELHRGLINEETGMLAGSGFSATEKGAAMISPCDVCGRLSVYEYDGKLECEQHYKHVDKLPLQ